MFMPDCAVLCCPAFARMLLLLCCPQAEGFEKLGATNGDKGLKQVVGAIDGSHIPISRPRNTVDEYCNRKKTFSVLLQAVCDHEGRFTDVYTGWTGRIHDARMLRESGLGKVSAVGVLIS